MIRTFLYSFSISCLLAMAAKAQVQPVTAKPATDTSAPKAAPKKPVKEAPQDTTYLAPGGLRIGVDLSRIALHFFQPYRIDVTVLADARLTQSLYLAMETGYNRTSHKDTSYSYKGNGVFATVGVDYNFLKRQLPTERHMVYAGIRYGFAHNSYEVPQYTIYNSYWGDKITGSYPKTNINSHWVELVFGMRVEALKNFFLGWSMRERILISSGAGSEFPPLVIPGYGSGSKKSVFDMQYTVSYCLPLWKVKVKGPKPGVKAKSKK